MTRFSVLIPVYNAEKTINRCVDSVLQQTFYDYEIVLVDDGSTDKSGKICDLYADRYSNIKVYHQGNKGSLLARIRALSLSVGQYCIFLDSDDWLQMQAFHRIEEVISKHDCDVVMYNYRCVSDTTEWLAEPVFDNGTIFTEENKKALLLEFFRKDTINSMWTKAVKRDVFFGDMDYTTLPQKISMGEDVLQSIHVYRKFHKLVYISDPLINYYINENGITRTSKSDIHYKDCNIVFEAKNQFIEEMGFSSSNVLIQFAEHYMMTIADYLLKMHLSHMKWIDELSVYKDIRNASVFKKMLFNFRVNELSESFTPRQKRAISLLIAEKYYCLYMYIRIMDYYCFIRGILAKLIRCKG